MRNSGFDLCPVCFVRHRKLPLPAACVDKADKRRMDLSVYLGNLRDAIAAEKEYCQFKSHAPIPE
jgi:hypothetical protein